jgi:hypothetical protein
MQDVQRLLTTKAAAYYRTLISTQEAFPDSSVEVRLVKEAWKFANNNSGTTIAITPDINKIVSNFFIPALDLHQETAT